MAEKEFLYVNEGFISSVLSDIFTFGCMFVGLFINHYFLDKRWYIDIFFIVFALIGTHAQSKIKKFKNKKDLIKYLQEDI